MRTWSECALLLLSLLAVIAAISLTSCGQVQIKDVEVCVDEGSLGASCFHSLSEKTRDLSKAEWDKKRFGEMSMNTDDWTNWKSAIEALCQNNSGVCNYETQASISRFFERLARTRQHVVSGSSEAAARTP